MNEKKLLVIPELALNLEEADLRIIPHVKWNLTTFPDLKSFVVISQDTDVFVLLCYYMGNFIELGLEKLWLLTGKGDKKRYIPITYTSCLFKIRRTVL